MLPITSRETRSLTPGRAPYFSVVRLLHVAAGRHVRSVLHCLSQSHDWSAGYPTRRSAIRPARPPDDRPSPSIGTQRKIDDSRSAGRTVIPDVTGDQLSPEPAQEEWRATLDALGIIEVRGADRRPA